MFDWNFACFFQFSPNSIEFTPATIADMIELLLESWKWDECFKIEFKCNIFLYSLWNISLHISYLELHWFTRVLFHIMTMILQKINLIWILCKFPWIYTFRVHFESLPACSFAQWLSLNDTVLFEYILALNLTLKEHYCLLPNAKMWITHIQLNTNIRNIDDIDFRINDWCPLALI